MAIRINPRTGEVTEFKTRIKGAPVTEAEIARVRAQGGQGSRAEESALRLETLRRLQQQGGPGGAVDVFSLAQENPEITRAALRSRAEAPLMGNQELEQLLLSPQADAATRATLAQQFGQAIGAPGVQQLAGQIQTQRKSALENILQNIPFDQLAQAGLDRDDVEQALRNIAFDPSFSAKFERSLKGAAESRARSAAEGPGTFKQQLLQIAPFALAPFLGPVSAGLAVASPFAREIAAHQQGGALERALEPVASQNGTGLDDFDLAFNEALQLPIQGSSADFGTSRRGIRPLRGF
ncbi:MAG: hypothetical protein QME66_05815 [Candidatus Eisenbacteria bacterium]|nr:hypothetical protein [Candidatus Eisenbacteria bacterium]